MADDPKPVEIKLPPQEPMLQAVGRGIQAFANVETGLGFVFASMMEPADRVSSVIVMDTCRQLETKLRVADAVAAHSLTGELLKDWKNLSSKLRHRAQVRHKLAHWTVSHWPGADSLETAKKQIVVLAPAMHSRDWYPVMWEPNTTDKRPLRLAEIETFVLRCNELFQDLVALSSRIQDSKKKP